MTRQSLTPIMGSKAIQKAFLRWHSVLRTNKDDAIYKTKLMLLMRSKRNSILNDTRQLWNKWLSDTRAQILKDKINADITNLSVINRMVVTNNVYNFIRPSYYNR